MKVIRKNLDTGEEFVVVTWEEINLQVAVHFLYDIAFQSSKERDDVAYSTSVIEKRGDLNINTITWMSKDKKALVEFRLE